jgi:chromosome segregation ATPase
MDEIKSQLNNIEKLIINLDKKVDEMNMKLQKVDSSCNKMDEHIIFIEDTYNILKTPLNYVKRSVDRLIGNNQNVELPSIKDKGMDKEIDKDK